MANVKRTGRTKSVESNETLKRCPKCLHVMSPTFTATDRNGKDKIQTGWACYTPGCHGRMSV